MTLSIDAANTLSTAQAATTQARTQILAQPQPQAASASAPSPQATLTLKSTGANVSAYTAVSDSLSRAASISDTAQAGAGSVLQILQQLKQVATSAASSDLATSDRATLASDFQSLVDQLSKTVAGASASGVNLIDGSATPGVPVVADADGGQATLTAYDLKPGGSTVTLSSDVGVDTASAATRTLSQVQSSLQGAGGVLSDLVTQAKQIGAHADFVAKLGGTAVTSDSGLDSQDGVRLQALQLSQDLSTQSGGIANAAPQSVLSLFRTSS